MYSVLPPFSHVHEPDSESDYEYCESDSDDDCQSDAVWNHSPHHAHPPLSAPQRPATNLPSDSVHKHTLHHTPLDRVLRRVRVTPPSLLTGLPDVLLYLSARHPFPRHPLPLLQDEVLLLPLVPHRLPGAPARRRARSPPPALSSLDQG